MSLAFDAFIDAAFFDGNIIVVGGLSFVGDETTTELSSMKQRSAPSNPAERVFCLFVVVVV